MYLRYGSNELDTFMLAEGRHCQALLLRFEPCLRENILLNKYRNKNPEERRNCAYDKSSY